MQDAWVKAPTFLRLTSSGVGASGESVTLSFADADDKRYRLELSADCVPLAIAALATELANLGPGVRVRAPMSVPVQDSQRSVEEARALEEIIQAISSSLDIQEVLGNVVRYAVELSDADGGAIFELNRVSKTIDFTASHNLAETFMEAVSRIPVDYKMVSVRTPVQISDLSAAEETRPFRDVALGEGFRSAVIVPIGGSRKFRGIVLLRRTAGEIDDRAMRVLETLANHSKVAIRNARLFDEIQGQRSLLAEAKKQKSTFLANMSHELTTPINAILGYTELVLDKVYGEVPGNVYKALERVDQNTRELLALIDEIFYVSRIEAGQLNLFLDDYRLEEVVQGVFSTMKPLATAKSLSLELDCPRDLPVGRGDHKRIRQVLSNLVDNAIKFTDHGSIIVTVKVLGDEFGISVSDTGPGVSKDDQQKIFAEFHQVAEASTKEERGTGIGLAIAKHIVEMHGGRIWIESTVGKGSTFWVTLPIRVDRQVDAL